MRKSGNICIFKKTSQQLHREKEKQGKSFNLQNLKKTGLWLNTGVQQYNRQPSINNFEKRSNFRN